MDYVDRLLGSRWAGVRAETLFKFSNLTTDVQAHLQRVYATLMAALALSAAGCYVDMTMHISGIITFIAALGCLIGLSLTRSMPHTLNKRYAMLAGFAFCQGASLGRLVNMAIQLHPGVLLTAFLGTAAVFLSFSLAALMSQRRSYLYLGGLLSSAISGFMILRLTTWMFGAHAIAFQAELYLGLMVFVGYVLFDTQMIVERAAAGERDHVKHALDLLVDVLAIFVRVLVILIRNAERKAEQERRKKQHRE